MTDESISWLDPRALAESIVEKVQKSKQVETIHVTVFTIKVRPFDTVAQVEADIRLALAAHRAPEPSH